MVKSGTIDDFDRDILSALRSDARISMLDLAERVGLSATPVARRVRKLDKQVDDALVRFEAAIASFPEVVDCWLMTGNRDYLLRVVTTSLAAFEQFLVGQLTRVRGVASIESSIPLRRVKSGVSRSA
ncbi:MAG: AsnC family transcriptional regulator [Acidiphilium sp. 21-68-69]|nr:MAG: AsnC family transcriptional regulator [Acidiphilium sp. 21-68-69]